MKTPWSRAKDREAEQALCAETTEWLRQVIVTADAPPEMISMTFYEALPSDAA